MKTKTTAYVVHSIVTAVLLLTAQISLAGSATWLASPQDHAWENPNNWTPGGPPNGPSDIPTFAQSSQRNVDISSSVEVNSIVFASNSESFGLNISPGFPGFGGTLIISGTGVSNNNNVLQTFAAGEGGQIIFNNSASAARAQMRIFNSPQLSVGNNGQTIFNDTSSAAGASIVSGGSTYGGPPGKTIFNDTSTADHASISNQGAGASSNPGNGGQAIFNGASTAANASIDNQSSVDGYGGYTIFNDTSTAGHATITNENAFDQVSSGGVTIFQDSSTADSAILVANGGTGSQPGGWISFRGTSTGGTARVKVFDNGSLDIHARQPSRMSVGSIEGSGIVYLGTGKLTVGTNNLNTSFSGVISGSGVLAKVGSGILTLQANDCIADTVGLLLVSGSPIKLDFTGPPDVIASLKVNGIPQPPGIYGGPMSGAPNIVLEFRGVGTLSVRSNSTLGNISTRAFVRTGDNVMIGGFIVQGTESKKVIIRVIGPELTRYGIPNALVNPTLELHDDTGALIASNDNWVTTIIGGIITANQVRDIQASGHAPGDGRESAIIAELSPGNYTAIVRGVNNSTGVGLVEVYDLSPGNGSILGNISTRAFVQTDNNVMIGGFIVQGTQQKRVILRAIGPSLTQYGVPNVLANPTLELHSGTGALIASNNNWATTIIGGIITANQVRDIQASGYAPGDGRESAIIADLPPGNYTAIVRGVDNTTGVGLVEVYDLP